MTRRYRLGELAVSKMVNRRLARVVRLLEEAVALPICGRQSNRKIAAAGRQMDDARRVAERNGWRLVGAELLPACDGSGDC